MKPLEVTGNLLVRPAQPNDGLHQGRVVDRQSLVMRTVVLRKIVATLREFLLDLLVTGIDRLDQQLTLPVVDFNDDEVLRCKLACPTLQQPDRSRDPRPVRAGFRTA